MPTQTQTTSLSSTETLVNSMAPTKVHSSFSTSTSVEPDTITTTSSFVSTSTKASETPEVCEGTIVAMMSYVRQNITYTAPVLMRWDNLKASLTQVLENGLQQRTVCVVTLPTVEMVFVYTSPEILLPSARLEIFSEIQNILDDYDLTVYGHSHLFKLQDIRPMISDELQLTTTVPSKVRPTKEMKSNATGSVDRVSVLPDTESDDNRAVLSVYIALIVLVSCCCVCVFVYTLAKIYRHSRSAQANFTTSELAWDKEWILTPKDKTAAYVTGQHSYEIDNSSRLAGEHMTLDSRPIDAIV